MRDHGHVARAPRRGQKSWVATDVGTPSRFHSAPSFVWRVDARVAVVSNRFSPKGAIVEHRSVASAARGKAARTGIDRETRNLRFASYSFGAALMEIVVMLIAGGCVCMLSDEERMSGVPQAMNARDVKWAFFTPSFSSPLSPGMVPALKTLALGGEAVDTEQPRVWVENVSLFILYGSAEQSVISLGFGQLSLENSSSERLGQTKLGGSNSVCWTPRRTYKT